MPRSIVWILIVNMRKRERQRGKERQKEEEKIEKRWWNRNLDRLKKVPSLHGS